MRLDRVVARGSTLAGDPWNVASIRTAERAGFDRESLRQQVETAR